METNRNEAGYQHQGTGSSEQKGTGRVQQKAFGTQLHEADKKDIAGETGLQPQDITDVKSTGAMSGRDDQSGGSGDRMEETSDNEPTEKY